MWITIHMGVVPVCYRCNTVATSLVGRGGGEEVAALATGSAFIVNEASPVRKAESRKQKAEITRSKAEIGKAESSRKKSRNLESRKQP